MATGADSKQCGSDGVRLYCVRRSSNDVMVCGIGTNSLFSLEAKYIPTNSVSASWLLDVSAWAGSSNELFFGLLGGTATNAAVLVDNIRFYSLQTDSVGDGIPDSWRAQYFPNAELTGTTTNYLSCATCDADGTGQNNLFKYVAGLDPTNPASVFVLQIQDVPNQPTQKNLVYGPIANGCTYVVESTTNLIGGVWSPQAVSAPLTNVNQVTVMDANATSRQKFYRVSIYNVITNIVVLDSVGDGIPDTWRAQYFPSVPSNMTNRQSCATCDADGTGQNNFFKYVAGLDPTNPASVFVLNISSATNQSVKKQLVLHPACFGAHVHAGVQYESGERRLVAAYDIYGSPDQQRQSGHHHGYKPDSATGVLPHRHLAAINASNGRRGKGMCLDGLSSGNRWSVIPVRCGRENLRLAAATSRAKLDRQRQSQSLWVLTRGTARSGSKRKTPESLAAQPSGFGGGQTRAPATDCV